MAHTDNETKLGKIPGVDFFRKCTACGKFIGFRSPYWLCSVSTCRKKSNPMTFCSIDCWEPHISVFNHKNAYAEEERAPSKEEYGKKFSAPKMAKIDSHPKKISQEKEIKLKENSQGDEKESLKDSANTSKISVIGSNISGTRKLIHNPNPISTGGSEMEEVSSSDPSDVLIVASKLKKYIKDRSGLNTSSAVVDKLSEIVRRETEKAIENCKNNSRKTVMDRDFE